MNIEVGKKYKHIPTGIVRTVKYVDNDKVIINDDKCASKNEFKYFWKEVEDDSKDNNNRINHPSYYQDPSGVECITVARHRDFNIGNALKYLWRAGLKTEAGISNKEKTIEDLNKAIWYINDEIKMLEKQ